MKNENSTENNFRIISMAIFIALSFITLRWLYTGNQARHFWPLLFMGLITAIFSISIDTYFQARRFKTSAKTKFLNKMKSILNILIAFGLSALIITSCKKKEIPAPTPVTTTDTGRVYLEFFNEVGGSSLSLNTQWYKNENGDSFTVSKFNYYISNISLNGSGTTASYTEPNSYHLIEHTSTPSEMAFYLEKVPAGKYTSVTLTIGVDSLRNVSGAQDGDLDPAKGNFWSWNTGYIMLKFEGMSPKAPTLGGILMLHSGGFSGANNVLKTITLPLPNEIEVTKGQPNHLHLRADVLKLFKSPNIIDFSTTTTIHMPGAAAKKLADNYANMFTITYAGL